MCHADIFGASEHSSALLSIFASRSKLVDLPLKFFSDTLDLSPFRWLTNRPIGPFSRNIFDAVALARTSTEAWRSHRFLIRRYSPLRCMTMLALERIDRGHIHLDL